MELCVVARSATLAVSRLFRDLVTTSATTVSRDVTSCCATVSSCCCPATWGPTWLWPLQLRQQAVYARTVYKDPRYAKPLSSVLRHIARSLSVDWFSLLRRGGLCLVVQVPAHAHSRRCSSCRRSSRRARVPGHLVSNAASGGRRGGQRDALRRRHQGHGLTSISSCGTSA